MIEFRWKSVYAYYILGILTALALIFHPESIEVPFMGTLLAFAFAGWVAMDQSWKAFKRQGRAAILVSLQPDEGGHSTIHPDDISLTMSIDKNSPSFCVFATGGFVHGGIEFRGSENFVICPPEHCESTGPAFICHTKLRRVKFEQLPDYIQQELMNIKYFSLTICRTKNNIWFGMTSKLDGTSVSKRLQEESRFVDQTSIINEMKTLLSDRKGIYEEKKRENKRGEQIVVNIPEQR